MEICMPIKVCIAGATGWTGSVVARHMILSDEFEVVGALARQHADQDQLLRGHYQSHRQRAFPWVDSVMM